MKATDFLNTQFIKQADLVEPVLATITDLEAVEYPTANGTADRRLKATFGDGKALNLNATNLKRIVKAYGDDCPQWIGKPLVLYWDDEVEFAGRITGGIRVRIPVATDPDTAVTGELAKTTSSVS